MPPRLHVRQPPARSNKSLDYIFDFDGTLVDSAPAILKGFERALAAHGMAPQVALDSRLIGPPLMLTLQRLTGVEDSKRLVPVADSFRTWYDSEGFRETRIYDGVEALLRDLVAAGNRLSLATNKRLKPTLALLDHLAWMPLFRTVYALDKVSPAYVNKAAMLAALLRDEAMDAGGACYVGDTVADAEAAAAVGLRFLAASWGYGDFTDTAYTRLTHPGQLSSLPL